MTYYLFYIIQVIFTNEKSQILSVSQKNLKSSGISDYVTTLNNTDNLKGIIFICSLSLSSYILLI